MSENTSNNPVRIAGTGSYLPEKELTNKEMETIVDTTDEWITSRTGIKSRRIAAEGQNTSDLATEAAKKALEQAGIDSADLDVIIVATITPDTLTPATACYVQHNLGAKNAVAFDVSAACSGFLFAMEVAQRMISDGNYKNALIIGAEKLSAFTNWEDRNTCVLFGDGAGAAVLTRGDKTTGRILATQVGSDGSQTSILNIPGGGSACPKPSQDSEGDQPYLAMQGREVFKLAVNAMKRASEAVIEEAGLDADNIKLIIPHQANLRIIDAIADRLTIPNEKVFVNLDKYGNTSAAAMAIALDEAHREGKIERGDNIVMVGFGAGLTYAAAAIEW